MGVVEWGCNIDKQIVLKKNITIHNTKFTQRKMWVYCEKSNKKCDEQRCNNHYYKSPQFQSNPVTYFQVQSSITFSRYKPFRKDQTEYSSRNLKVCNPLKVSKLWIKLRIWLGHCSKCKEESYYEVSKESSNSFPSY